MSYFRSDDGCLFFGESEGADRTALSYGFKPCETAPTVPAGTTYTEIADGLSRLDVPPVAAPPLASLADAYGGSGFADEY